MKKIYTNLNTKNKKVCNKLVALIGDVSFCNDNDKGNPTYVEKTVFR